MVLCTDEFHALAKSEAEILGMSGLPLVILPHPMAKRSDAEVGRIAAAALDEIVECWSGDAKRLRAFHQQRQPEAKGRLRHRNLSRNELAQRCGLTSGYMSQLFNWERSPSPSARRRIQENLGVDDFDALFVVVKLDE